MRVKFLITRAIEKAAARGTKMQFDLLNLPNEIIALIVENVDNITTLRNLACTSSRIQQLSEPVLWRNLLVRQSSKLKEVLRVLQACPSRLSALQYLNVPCDNSFTTLAVPSSLIEKAPNLKELTVETPKCNGGQFEDEAEWRLLTEAFFLFFRQAASGSSPSPRPLQKLQSLTLHMNGPNSPYWTPNARSLSILVHPTISYLKISCMNLPATLFKDFSDAEKASTPLKNLVLLECNITHQGLHGLLAWPKALESLYLGENCHNERNFPGERVPVEYNHLFRFDSGTTLEALSQQKHSLKALTYAVAAGIVANPGHLLHMFLRRQPGVDAGFADFLHLETIASIGSCSAFERAVMSSRPPPTLRKLTYQAKRPIQVPRRRSDKEPVSDGDVLAALPFLRAPSASVPPTLQKLDIIYEASDQLPYQAEFADVLYIRRVGSVLKQTHDATLTVRAKMYGRYFPPFLYGESEPRDTLIYDGMSDEWLPSPQLETSDDVDDDDDEDDIDDDDGEEWEDDSESESDED